MELNDYDLLEQHDFIEVERKELQMKFIEQTNFIFATAKDAQLAKDLVERLKVEYFVDYISRKKADMDTRTSELIEMQSKAYRITAAGSGLILQIDDAKQ